MTALGRYELITQIGQGGMAEVQLAIQRGPAGFEKLVVVKLVHENLATQKAFVDMLLDEARMAAMLKHPNVVDIYDLGQADGRYFIAMEYLEGEPLLAVLRAGREGKRLDPLSTGRLIADTAEGLDAAHELRTMAGEPIELVHHDVSLGNIVVLYNGQVKLVDFGVAKAGQSMSENGARARVQGKFSYMAPEKLRGGAGDRRSDIWSLGCVLWEALTLRRLFKGGNDAETMRQVLETKILAPSRVNGDVPPEFDSIVLQALEREPDLRYATAKAMAQDLEEVLREHKYGGKNDVIARYMQSTFESHIAARKKLLQEVSSKGRASADVVEAAFTEPMNAGGTAGSLNTSGEFSVTFKRSGEMPTVMPEGTPARSAESGARALAQIEGVSERRRSESGVLRPPTGSELRTRARTASWQPVDPSRPDDPLQPPGGGTIAQAPDRKKLVYVLLATAAVLGIIAFALSRGGSKAPRTEEDHPVVAPAVPRPPDPTPVPVVVPDAAIAVAPDAAEAEEIAIEPDDVTNHDKTPKVTPRPKDPKPPVAPPSVAKSDVETVFRAGLNDYVAGNNAAAIASFKRAVSINPGFAPTWRALGHAYEKTGDKSSAKSAFRRYLQLSPNAPDAPSVRARVDAL